MSIMWIGFTTPTANTGLHLRDNGICVVDEEELIFAISEERLSRLKHDYGIGKSLRAAIDFIGDSSRIKGYGVSSCSDTPWSPKEVPSCCDSFTSSKLPSHHYSHALSAFLLSPFDESLILVMDAGGNTFSKPNSSKWWAEPREQTTLWIGRENKVYLLERNHFLPHSVGYGEWYRAITYFLGWHSHTLSGNTMALSAFGEAENICESTIGRITSQSPQRLVQNDPENPISMVLELLSSVGQSSLTPRTPDDPILESHRHLAAYLQSSLEVDVQEYIEDVTQQHSVSKLCMSGGVSQNCLLNSQLAQSLGSENIYVSPFSGDTGQCVGNALYARNEDIGNTGIGSPPNTFWGLEYSDKTIKSAINARNLDSEVLDRSQLSRRIANRLADGAVLAIYRGRSEFGPRALGHRSVIGDACQKNVISRIKSGVKQRAEFMPLAPVIHEELGNELTFDIAVSETMVYAPVIPESYRDEFGHSLHVDYSARLQVVRNNFLLHSVLDEFYNITGRRVLVNTSFNSRGNPMVETPSDAVSAFLKLDIDILVIGRRWIEKA